jgi:hypothetical protein
MTIRMPEPPSVSPFTRYLFENPIPLAAVAAVAAAWLVVSGLRRGDLRRAGIGLAVALVGAGIVGLAALVVTSGERAKIVTRAFVDAVVGKDLVGAMNLVAERAALTLGSPTSEGVDRDTILSLVSESARQFTVTSNRVTLRGFGESSEAGVAHLACVTQVEGGYGPTASEWVIRVARQPDGEWQIERLTWVRVNGRAVTGFPW